MLKNIIITNPKRLEKLKKEISKKGKEKLHVLSDFDRTLTHAFVKGEKVPSLISILRSSGRYLSKDYVEKANALYEKYHPIEVNLKLSIKKKKKAMEEWWRAHFELLVKSGFNKKILEKVAESPRIKFREGALEFFNFLYTRKIPLIIMSSSGLGGEVISMAFKRAGKLYSNIYIISNSFIWDKRGNAIRIKEPIIHALNKDETVLKDFSFYPIIKDRKNVLLLGDNIEDIGMIEGFKYDNLIKIGFLNEKIQENLEEYKKAYDILILNDFSIDYVNLLLKEILTL